MASLTIRFEIRKDKINSEGRAPISCIVSVSQQRKRIATEISIPADNWDKDAQKAGYVSKKQHSKISLGSGHTDLLMGSDVDQINSILEKIKSRLNFIENGFRINDVSYTVEDIVKNYQLSLPGTGGKAPDKIKIPNLREFITTYIERNRSSRAKGSLKVYNQLSNHLNAFELWDNSVVTFERVGLSLFEEFQNFLIEERTQLNNITIAKQLSSLKTVLGYARKNGIEMSQSYRDFTIKKQKLEVITLAEEEYKTIKTIDLKGVSRHEKARDIFIFLCATSMRYSDYNQFRREHIKGKVIQLTMKKTQKPWNIPLNPDSLSIIEKYQDLVEPLPKISNQKLSKYIKEICEVAEINELIEIVRYKGAEPIREVFPKHELVSAHTGRKTFCTLSLERGAPVETVMKWSGHEDYNSFKRYVNLSRTHSISEMERVWGKTEIMKAV
jgi:integrase